MGAWAWGAQGARGTGEAETGMWQGLGPAGEKEKKTKESGSAPEDPSFHLLS